MKMQRVILTLFCALTMPTRAWSAEIDWKKVDAALDKTAVISGEVHRYGLRRAPTSK